MPPVAGVTGGSVVVAYAYMLGGGKQDGRMTYQEHKWVLMSVGLKVFDMLTDWAFYFVSLRGEPFESEYMYKLNGTRRGVGTGRYNKDVITIQTAALLSCGCGTMLTFADICGTRQRLGPGAAPLASIVTLLVMLVEDVPQLTMNIIYIKTMAGAEGTTIDLETLKTMGSAEGSAVDTISILALLSSLFTIGYSIYLLCCWGSDEEEDTERPGSRTIQATSNPMYGRDGSGV